MVAFNSTTISHQLFHKDRATIFFFYGRNHTADVVVNSSTTNCGCTRIHYPPVLKENEPFTVTITIDKTGQSGYVSQSATMTLGDGQKFSFNVSGKIED